MLSYDTDKFWPYLECKVDAMCLRPDGQMIIVADSQGAFHIISISGGNIIFSHQVVDQSCNTNFSNNGNLMDEERRSSDSLFNTVGCLADEEKGLLFNVMRITSSLVTNFACAERVCWS